MTGSEPSRMHTLTVRGISGLIVWIAVALPAVAEEVVTVLLKDGAKVSGAVVTESDTSVELRLADGSTRTISVSDVKDFYFGAVESEDESDDEDEGKPRVIYDEDDIPSRRRGGRDSPRGARDSGGRAGKPTPPKTGTAKAGTPPKNEPDDAPTPAAEEQVTWRLVVPEHHPLDCGTCEGYKQHDCWLCEKGVLVRDGETSKCQLCRGGKAPCRHCGGTGDTPDPARSLPCPGCPRGASFALAPGKWACPSCVGYGTYSIIGGAKSAKCGVCEGRGTFDCGICGGAGTIPRLFPPAKRPDPESWRARLERGRAAIASSGLTGGAPLGSGSLKGAARSIPALGAMGKRLQGQLDQAEMLTKQNIEGSEETAAFFKRVFGLAVQALLVAEGNQLEIEEGYLEEDER